MAKVAFPAVIAKPFTFFFVLFTGFGDARYNYLYQSKKAI